MIAIAKAVAFWSVVAPAQASAGQDDKAGQVWRYLGGEATIAIFKVDDVPRIGHVIHVPVDKDHRSDRADR